MHFSFYLSFLEGIYIRNKKDKSKEKRNFSFTMFYLRNIEKLPFPSLLSFLLEIQSDTINHTFYVPPTKYCRFYILLHIYLWNIQHCFHFLALCVAKNLYAALPFLIPIEIPYTLILSFNLPASK